MKSLIILGITALSALTPVVAQNTPFTRGREKNPIPAKVETMYTRGLKYLSRSQQQNGAWGTQHSAAGITGLSILAMLAHGDDPNHGPYAKNIKKGVDYLIGLQEGRKKGGIDDGYMGGTMYNHGFATLALAEVYGVVNDKKIGSALKKAVQLILNAQKHNRLGSWHYQPKANRSDTTVAGCQIVALYAARNAGIPVPDEAFKKGLKYMKTCRGARGAYGYSSRNGGKPTLTAIGVLCMALAKEKETDDFKESVKYLQKNINYRESHYIYYFEYYMSQALFQADEALWQEWNAKNIRFLSALQAPDGQFTSSSHGPDYATSSALLSLALNYRFLPIYEK